MKISLSKNRIKEDMILKSHLELETEKDLEKKWNARVDEDKDDETDFAIDGSVADLEALCWRYLGSSSMDAITDEDEDGNEVVTDTIITFNFAFSNRRMAEKLHILESRMHSYIVHSSLVKFYDTVEAQELSAQHEKDAMQIAESIERMIYAKQPPIL